LFKFENISKLWPIELLRFEILKMAAFCLLDFRPQVTLIIDLGLGKKY